MAKKVKTVITITEEGIEIKTNDPDFTGVFENNYEGKETIEDDVIYSVTPRQLRRLDQVVRILERNERREGRV